MARFEIECDVWQHLDTKITKFEDDFNVRKSKNSTKLCLPLGTRLRVCVGAESDAELVLHVH